MQTPAAHCHDRRYSAAFARSWSCSWAWVHLFVGISIKPVVTQSKFTSPNPQCTPKAVEWMAVRFLGLPPAVCVPSSLLIMPEPSVRAVVDYSQAQPLRQITIVVIGQELPFSARSSQKHTPVRWRVDRKRPKPLSESLPNTHVLNWHRSRILIRRRRFWVAS
jgi:hypothetical protein